MGGTTVRRVAAALAVAGLLAPLVATSSPGASAQSPVDAWVTIADTDPSVGCAVDTTVELRQGGVTVPDVEVGIALVLDGEILSADRGFTGGDGLAYMAVDTSGAPAGREAWLDVLVGGDYVGGTPVQVTDDGACADHGAVLEVTGLAPVAHSEETLQGWAEPGTPAEAAPDAGTGPGLWVPARFQQRPLSCEYAAASIAMAAFGAEVSEYAFDALVGWSDNPHWGYRGDITGAWGGTDDYGVYAAPLAEALPAFGFWGEAFYADGDASALTARLDQGLPTVVWLGIFGDVGFDAYTEDGTRYRLAAGEHTVVAYDYDEGGVYASDPGTGMYVYYPWDSFMAMWGVFDGMSLAVGPM